MKNSTYKKLEKARHQLIEVLEEVKENQLLLLKVTVPEKRRLFWEEEQAENLVVITSLNIILQAFYEMDAIISN